MDESEFEQFYKEMWGLRLEDYISFFKALGVETKNENGHYKSVYEIMKEASDLYEKGEL